MNTGHDQATWVKVTCQCCGDVGHPSHRDAGEVWFTDLWFCRDRGACADRAKRRNERNAQRIKELEAQLAK